MAALKEDKHKRYARYAAYCLETAAASKNRAAGAIQSEMAAEWLELTDLVLQPPKRWRVIKPT